MARACFFRFKVAKSYCRPLANAILLNVSSFAFKSRSCVMAIFRFYYERLLNYGRKFPQQQDLE